MSSRCPVRSVTGRDHRRPGGCADPAGSSTLVESSRHYSFARMNCRHGRCTPDGGVRRQSGPGSERGRLRKARASSLAVRAHERRCSSNQSSPRAEQRGEAKPARLRLKPPRSAHRVLSPNLQRCRYRLAVGLCIDHRSIERKCRCPCDLISHSRCWSETRALDSGAQSADRSHRRRRTRYRIAR